MINSVTQFSYIEELELARELEKHHSVFYQFWNLGKPMFTDEVDTACVVFNKDGELVTFKINPAFWSKLTLEQKIFVISHECLHVLLNHGKRFDLDANIDLQNIAMDIVVNEMLVSSKFLFSRKQVDPNNEACWLNTVFDDQTVIKQDGTFEYYYQLLKKQDNLNKNYSQQKIIDQHLTSSSSKDNSAVDDVLKALGDQLSNNDKNSLKPLVEKHNNEQIKNNQAGKSPGNSWLTVSVEKVVQKKKWETVIKRWAHKFLKDGEQEQWARPNRRMQLCKSSLMLPSDAEVDAFERTKISVWFFQDTSGSCSSFADRFFKAAKSLPKNRFDIKMHCFDTYVYETSLESGRLYGFGGTSFSCIENYIQKYVKQHNVSYPKAVFIITDGFGDHVNPEKPKNWYWFLSADYKECIPVQSNIYKLSDYE